MGAVEMELGSLLKAITMFEKALENKKVQSVDPSGKLADVDPTAKKEAVKALHEAAKKVAAVCQQNVLAVRVTGD
jgi:hypothetical protein